MFKKGHVMAAVFAGLVFLGILLFVGIVIVFILLLIVILSVIGVHRHANMLQCALPWMQWLTLDDVKNMGYSGYWSRLSLALLHLNDRLEVRLANDRTESVSKEMCQYIEKVGFIPSTVAYYDFRLIARRGRVRRRAVWSSPRLLWRPAAV